MVPVRKFLLVLCLVMVIGVTAFASQEISFTQMEDAYQSGSPARFTFYIPRAGNATIIIEDAAGQVVQTLAQDHWVITGYNNIERTLQADNSPLAPGEYTLVLTMNNQRATAPLLIADSGENKPSSPTEDPAFLDEDPKEDEDNTNNENEDDEESAADTQASNVTTEPGVNPSSPFSPSDYSPHDCEHENCFWTLPMGEMNEEAIWAAMMEPITVVSPTRDTAGDRQSFYVYEQPSEESPLVAEVTAVSQGVHVLNNTDDGWSLIEGYSSSFHNSKVKNYGGFFQGYIKTSRLEEKKPSDKYGILIDKLTQRMYVLEEGKILTELLISTGLVNAKQPYNETPAGDYLVVSWTGGFYSGNMYCDMALRINAGILLHEVPCLFKADGSRNYAPFEPLLGQKASHGCIRVQKALTPEGANMKWLWDNLKKNTRVFVWEDKGRMRDLPDDATPLYYNPDGGKYFHSHARCASVRDKFLPLSAFAYGQLDSDPFSTLQPCPSCSPPMRKEEIEALNQINALTLHDGAEKAPVVVSASTPLYYNPDGGQFYHGLAHCPSVAKKYLPLSPFTYIELYNSPFDALSPCSTCAPPEPGALIDEDDFTNEGVVTDDTGDADDAGDAGGIGVSNDGPLPQEEDEGEEGEGSGEVLFFTP